MNNTSELYMTSKSGYAMPFDDRGEQVEVLLPFGEQKHPDTGQKFFHHGIDLKAHYFVLSALADGVVTGVGNDARHGLFVIATYDDKYVVTYGHLSSVHVMFGQKLQAGMAVGVSGKERLHLGVRYKEEEIDPLEFITMLYANVRSWNTNSEQGTPEFVSFDMDVHTDYDQDKEEIEQLMMRYYPAYMEELLQGSYRGTEHIIQSLRNLFTVGSMKQYFMETLPSIANPMGVTRRAVPLVSKAQNLLISDFLNYLAIRQQVFLSSMGDPQKKNLKRKGSPRKDT